ncbi:MAG: hypothetical protein AAF449_03530 [Myxococcota bacterium]
MWLAHEDRRTTEQAIGLVDLAVFMGVKNLGQDVLDDYFQLQRAVPP